MDQAFAESGAAQLQVMEHKHGTATYSPGRILADELTELQMSAAQLGRELHVPTNRITQILGGKRAITANTVLRLGQWLGTGPEFWLNLQKSYELRLAEREHGNEIRSRISPRHAS